MLRSFIAKPNLNSINAIHPRIAGWSAAENLHVGSRKKSKMGQVMAHFFWQIDAFHHARTANLRVT